MKLAELRDLLLPTLRCDLPEPDKWYMFVDYTSDCLCLKHEDLNQVTLITTQLSLDTYGEDAAAKDAKKAFKLAREGYEAALKGAKSTRAASIQEFRTLLLPGIYRFPNADDWDLITERASLSSAEHLMLYNERTGNSYWIISSDMFGEERDPNGLLQDAAKKRFKSVERLQQTVARVQEQKKGNPLSLIPRLAEAIVGLIQSKPSSPTAPEIEDLIKRFLDQDHEAAQNLPWPPAPKPRNLKISSAATRGELGSTKFNHYTIGLGDHCTACGQHNDMWQYTNCKGRTKD